MTAAPAGVVLAAGAGTRVGGPKAILRLGDELLVDRAARTLRSGGCAPVIVVLGAQADEVRATASLLAADAVVDNPDWETGMASSLRCGLSAARELGAPAALVALVDQPGITPTAITRLAETWSAGAVAAVATYDGAPRNPVLLDARVWDEVAAAATGDAGARAWLRANPDRVVAVPCDDIADADDIDTPEDLARLTLEST